MGLARLYSRALRGMNAPEVVVEVHVAGGLPAFSIVGLPDVEVRESRDRVRSAIQMSGFDFPARRITVNLAPADLPKESGRYDLPIALGVLLASGLIVSGVDVEQYEFAGELALDGSLRKISGALAIAHNIHGNKREFILSTDSAAEAALVHGVTVYRADSLNQVVTHLTGECLLSRAETNVGLPACDIENRLDFSQVVGQIGAKNALEIAASGRHSVLMLGNPGCGKSMLAERFATLLPPLTMDEALEVASINSLCGKGFNLAQFGKIPFRQPHHSSSSVAIVGGGSNPKPGEISLAHRGVLFLDEIPEFGRNVLEMLREPLETKSISIARANNKAEFPADFQLLAAMNPCPCGNHGHPYNTCKCSPEQVNKYMGRLSAPLLDRIDLIVEMPYLKTEDLTLYHAGMGSHIIRERVMKAREIQLQRQNKLNYALNLHEMEEHCRLDDNANKLLQSAATKLGLSARSYHKIIRISRTIADIEQAVEITGRHVAQALQYKKKS